MLARNKGHRRREANEYQYFLVVAKESGISLLERALKLYSAMAAFIHFEGKNTNP